MEYIATYHTDVGTRKETNQDSLAIKVVNTKEGNVAFAIVCDGMGGLAKGEVASKEVIEAFCTWFDDTLVDEIQNGTFTEQNLVTQWDDIIQTQNRRLGAYGEENHLQLGTTVSAILLYKDQYYCSKCKQHGCQIILCQLLLKEDDTHSADHDRLYVVPDRGLHHMLRSHRPYVYAPVCRQDESGEEVLSPYFAVLKRT